MNGFKTDLVDSSDTALSSVDTIAELYENAHRVQPDSEDILSSLFMAYVRISDYKKQQQTAMRLHRLQPTKNPYYFWAIMSIVMQVAVGHGHTLRHRDAGSSGTQPHT